MTVDSTCAVIHGKRKGLVSSTKIMVDLRYGDGVIINNVDTKQLKHLQPFRFQVFLLTSSVLRNPRFTAAH